MWGIYTAKTREEIKAKDPKGYALMDKQFFHPYFTYNARIDADFKGNFSLKFDPLKPYTHHSQYLKDITLLGSNDNSVTVNELDNHIIGNSGNNAVIFSGKFAEYQVTKNKDKTIVKDTVINRDGKNVLFKVEKLQFVDKAISL